MNEEEIKKKGEVEEEKEEFDQDQGLEKSSLDEPETETEPEQEEFDEDQGLNQDSPEQILEEQPEGEVEQSPIEQPEKMLTQSQVNELVGRARQEGRESAMRELYNRYGVGGDEELNDIFGRGQAYDSLNDDYKRNEGLYQDAMVENALLKSNVDKSRWDDIKLILNGKGLGITPETIESMIPSHPEWRSAPQQQEVIPNKVLGSEEMEALMNSQPSDDDANAATAGMLRVLGNGATPTTETISDDEKAKKLFGM